MKANLNDKNSRLVLALLILAVVMAALGGLAIVNRDTLFARAAENLLVNPGFEGPFSAYNGIGELQVSQGWAPFWTEGNPPAEMSQGPCARPEWKNATVAIDARRVHSGAQAQQWFTFYKVHWGGVYQKAAVTKGSTYELSAWATAWSNNVDDPAQSPGEIYLSLCIDPYGRSNAWDQGVICTPWEWVTNSYEQVTTAPIRAEANTITVYLMSWAKYRLKHDDMYVDDVALVQTQAGTQPTQTPWPTYTPYPTLAPLPTYTPQVCPAVTPCPTCAPGGECAIDDFIWIPVTKEP